MLNFNQSFKKQIIGIILVIAFFTIVKPAYMAINNIQYIQTPITGDFYIINSSKFEKTQYALDPEKKHYHDGFKILKIKSITANDIIFVGGDGEYRPYSWAKENLLDGKTSEEDYFREENIVSIPKDQLAKLNLFRTISSIHRIKDPEKIKTIKLANQYYKDKDYIKTSEQFAIIAKNDPSAENFAMLGYTQYLAKQYNEAINSLSKAIALNPEDPKPYHTSGTCYASLFNYKKASDFYELSLQKDPNYAKSYEALAYVSAELGDFQKSVANYQLAVQ